MTDDGKNEGEYSETAGCGETGYQTVEFII